MKNKEYVKGKKLSREHKNKISLANIGKHYGYKTEFKKGHKSGMTGKKHSEETKRKQSLARIGWIPSKEVKEKRKETIQRLYGNKNGYVKGNTGKKYPKELYPEYGLRKVRKNQLFPNKDTSIEIKIQNYLRELKIGFFTHIYMDEILNSYQCDILIPVQKNKEHFIKQPIVIECDGDYWHSYPVGREIDHIRTSELISKGFKVLRLWESDIRIMDINKLKELVIKDG